MLRPSLLEFYVLSKTCFAIDGSPHKMRSDPLNWNSSKIFCLNLENHFQIFPKLMSSPTHLPEAIDRIVQRFQRLSDPKQRYEQLILYGKKLEAFPEALKTPDNKVQGCVSQVYVVAKLDANERVVFSGDSDALISKGFVGLLSVCMGGLTQKEIELLTPDFIKDTGLVASLTPSRANGFYNVFKKMQQQAMEIELPSVR